ncbi:10420_t:CDS:2 [Funneliformis geosporum]|uniref:10420_t:CDS:1 n=1 Tax=Funneliformis geosporum TaxID=1117311 RepID=A0A9W4WYT3_9GLOM|nr:10420_t:CDS:2 [Funneliformis geosporum]
MAKPVKSNNQRKLVSKKILTDRISTNLSKNHSLSKIQIETVLSELLEETKKALIKGEELRFPSYFSVKTTLQAARVAMNLQTKKKMSIPAKRVPKLKRFLLLIFSLLFSDKDNLAGQVKNQPKHQPRVSNLECSKQEITAFLEDGRKLTVPTT